MDALPLIIEPDSLQAHLAQNHLLIIAVCQQQVFASQHIPGSVLVQPAELVSGVKPAVGKLPDADRLGKLFSRLGLAPDKHVIVYDDEGGGWAGRLIWTLDVIGHHHYSLLDGGLIAWVKAGLPLQSGSESQGTAASYNDNTGSTEPFDIEIDQRVIASLDEVQASIHDDSTIVWDARSPEEYAGTKITSLRNGHVPGAVNLDWLELMDRENDLRLKPLEELRSRVEQLGISKADTVITHCQTHHRSGLTYLVGKALGMNIKAYDGSWSEWGNLPDTPVET